MSAEVLDYHKNPKAEARWANMERLHLMRERGIIPAIASGLTEEENGLVRYAIADTAPSELSYGHQDGDVA